MDFLIIIVCIAVFIKSFKEIYKMSKYEFKNRTEGGAVKFRSFEDSIKHNGKMMLYSVLLLASLLVGGLKLAFL